MSLGHKPKYRLFSSKPPVITIEDIKYYQHQCFFLLSVFNPIGVENPEWYPILNYIYFAINKINRKKEREQ